VGGPPRTPDCKEPKTVGFYKRLCMGPHPEDELTQANADCVNDSVTFRWVRSVADICNVLYPNPENDKCEQAESQFMGALLNRCKTRLYNGEAIVSSCSTHMTVGESIAHADSVLSKATRTKQECTHAQCESEELNSGAAIKANSLRVERTTTGTLLRWAEPPSSSAWPPPKSYYVWRRRHGNATFTVLADVPGFSYEDPSMRDGINYDYLVTVHN
jgi:hypothetical protein